MILNQSAESKIYIYLEDNEVACVTGYDVSFERENDASGDINTSKNGCTVKLERYFPIGVDVGSFYACKDFNLTVSDNWSIMKFSNCNWHKIDRKGTIDGVYETVMLKAGTVKVV